MAEAGIGAEQHEHVGKAGDGGAEGGGHAALGPGVAQRQPVAADHGQRIVAVGDVEAGAEQDGVGGALDAIGADDAGLGDAVDAAIDDLDVGPGERRVVVVGAQDALAADLVGRGQALLQLQVGDGAGAVLAGHHAGQAGDLRVAAHRQVTQFLHGEDGAAPQQPQAGEQAQQGAGAVGDLAIALRHHPGRGALIQRELRHQRRDLRHELDRAGAGADDRDALVLEIEPVVPAGGVEALAPERLQAGDARDQRQMQGADREHHHRRREAPSVGGSQGPACGPLVPARLGQGGAEAQMRREAAPGDDALEVGEDVGLRGEGALPVGFRLRRDGIEVRRDVAGAAGIGVVAPGAADAVGLLQDQERDAPPLEAQRHDQAGEAAADDHHLRGLGAGGWDGGRDMGVHRLSFATMAG